MQQVNQTRAEASVKSLFYQRCNVLMLAPARILKDYWQGFVQAGGDAGATGQMQSFYKREHGTLLPMRFSGAQNRKEAKSMQRISKVLFVPLFVLLAALFFSGCDLLKFSKISYKECLGPADEGKQLFTFYKFDQNFFVPPGTLTMKTKIDAVHENEFLPPAVRFNFEYKDKSTTLVRFQEDLELSSTGKLPTLKLTFLDPGVQFRTKQTIRLGFTPLLDELHESNWIYKLHYNADAPLVGILPIRPVNPSRSPMSISVGDYEDFE